jgi:hypothetical protein
MAKKKKKTQEILNIQGHKGNANQNHTKIPPHLSEWLPSRTQTTNVGEDVGKKESSYTAGGYEISTITMENSMEATQKTKNRTAM